MGKPCDFRILAPIVAINQDEVAYTWEPIYPLDGLPSVHHEYGPCPDDRTMVVNLKRKKDGHIMPLNACKTHAKASPNNQWELMKSASDFSIEELRAKIGTRVVSAVTATLGTLVAVSDEIDSEDYTIDVVWDNGKESRKVWHFWTENILL